MHKFNPFGSKLHHDSWRRRKTTLKTNPESSTSVIINNTTPTQSITISAPLISHSDTIVINDKDQSIEDPNEEQTSTIENDNVEEQIILSTEIDKMSGEYNHVDDQPVSPLPTSSNQSSSVTVKKTDSTTTMVGNNLREDILTSCKATAMIYNDAQKKWIHCAPNGPARIQLLFNPDTQSYRIVGRQIQDQEIVLNHGISKGIKYNQATPTFHQWRDQTSVYGLNFLSKLDAQEFGTTMVKILDSVNGSTNLSSQTNANGGVTFPSSTQQQQQNNNNNNNSTTSHKRQANQPSSSSFPPTATTVSINSTYSSTISEPPTAQQQQQLHSSSSYNNQLRPSLSSINSTSTCASNNYYSQHQQPPEDEDANYALISDSLSSYGDNSTSKSNTIPQAPPLNLSMSTGSAPPPAAPPPPPPPPPPPLPAGFGNGPPSAPALILPTANGNGGGSTPRKSSTIAPATDLMSEMAAKFAQRRKQTDEGDKTDSSNTTKTSPKAPSAATLPPATAAPIPTSPRIPRKGSESHLTPNYTANDLEKLKTEILTEIRKDIEKAKQEILTALLDRQKPIRK